MTCHDEQVACQPDRGLFEANWRDVKVKASSKGANASLLVHGWPKPGAFASEMHRNRAPRPIGRRPGTQLLDTDRSGPHVSPNASASVVDGTRSTPQSWLNLFIAPKCCGIQGVHEREEPLSVAFLDTRSRRAQSFSKVDLPKKSVKRDKHGARALVSKAFVASRQCRCSSERLAWAVMWSPLPSLKGGRSNYCDI